MVMKQEEIYWMDLGEPKVSEPGYSHPLLEKIGTLSKSKFSEVLDGVRLLLEPKDIK